MNRQFIAEQMSALGGFDWIDVTDDVRDGHVGRSEFLDKAGIAIDPIDVRHVAVQRDRLTTVSADRMKRIVVDFGTSDDWNVFVKQIGELANDAALRLTAQAQQNQVMPRQNRIN